MKRISGWFLAATVLCVTIFTAGPVQAGVIASSGCVPQYFSKCVSNIAYWYTSCGALQDIRQNCNLTGQVCMNGQCVNRIKPTPVYRRTTPKPTPTPVPQAKSGTLAIVVIARNEGQGSAASWEKNVSGNPNDTIDFFAVVKNISTQQAKDVTVSANMQNVSLTGSFTINDQPAAGNILSGVDLGSLSPGQTDFLEFSGTIPQSGQSPTVSISAHSGSVSDTDSVTIASAATPYSSPAPTASGSQSSFWDAPFFQFIRQWWLLIIIVVILLVLFVIIFRRLASEEE